MNPILRELLRTAGVLLLLLYSFALREKQGTIVISEGHIVSSGWSVLVLAPFLGHFIF